MIINIFSTPTTTIRKRTHQTAISIQSESYPICFKMATDFLENFRIFLAKNRFCQNLKSQISKLFQLCHYHGSKEYSLDYHLHILAPGYMSTDLLENFHIFLARKSKFSKLKISNRAVVIPAIPQLRSERGLSGLPISH